MWETEDTEADPQRKLIFMARAPRAFGGNTHTAESGVFVVSVADPAKPFRVRTVGTWGVAGQEGSRSDTEDCSAHYFSVHNGILAQSFYSQGTRFLDVRDPAHPTQVAYFRPDDAMSWAPY